MPPYDDYWYYGGEFTIAAINQKIEDGPKAKALRQEPARHKMVRTTPEQRFNALFADGPIDPSVPQEERL